MFDLSQPLGVCTWTFGPQPLERTAATLRTLGYDGVELHGDLDAFTPSRARAILDGEGLRLFSLTPANVDPAHPDSAIRQAAVDYYMKLVDFAAEAGGIVSVHGHVGRVAPVASMAAERSLLVQSVRRIAGHAEQSGVDLVFEVLNRYEAHLINTCGEALALMRDIGSPRLKVLLDAYHMNIEESDPVRAVHDAGNDLGLFHVADSNRDAIGRGHTDFRAIFAALNDTGYAGPVIVECTPPGPNPFTPVKDPDSVAVLVGQLRACRAALTGTAA
ncbi:sugar phosphate isomerase/epimerase family protein [Bosea sp. BK604]|uniref:sugar phosphate isomerase/epimerase family protein n=1 Tax=Bosea sp. BK604 TaxID=2512180 RepID=UPI00104FC4E6|nr:sugar phosphate isomerase/epimerase family protein [Bosea sp. BK604]TCR64591.1 sugar phosphate isomerase/epimerase [Bosea sp. BK604]